MDKRRWIGVVVALGAAVIARGQSRQQAYEAAQAAYDRGEWQAAADGLAPLLLPVGRSSRIDGMLRARYANALLHLNRIEEGRSAATRATEELAGAPAADPERLAAQLASAEAAAAELDLSGAIAGFRDVEAAAPANSAEQREATLGIAQAALTVDPKLAEAALTRAIAGGAFPLTDKTQQALATSLQAIVRLNAGDPAGALPLAQRAVSLSGGSETASINVLQAIVRQDAALVMLRANRESDAREMLAHSGGGYMPNSGWLLAAANDLPICDESVRPDDFAVVEISVGDDGTVTMARPIYASRPGQIGTAFAAKALAWRFDPRGFAKLPPFWRHAIRLELRCASRPPALAIGKPFADATRAWLASLGIAAAGDDTRPFVPRVPAEASGPVARLAAALIAVRDPHPKGGRDAAGAEVVAATDALGAPVEVQAYIAYSYTFSTSAGQDGALASTLAERYAARPGGKPVAAWMDVIAALKREGRADFAGAAPLLDRVLALPPADLPPGDPVRVVATLHRALIDRRAGDAAAADARIRAAGIGVEQCSLFDVHPLPVREGVSSSDYPTEALSWQMEGFAQTGFDIGADGRVTGARTLRAYPPFVFGRSSERAVERFRYLPPTLNNVALGCSAYSRTFQFKTGA